MIGKARTAKETNFGSSPVSPATCSSVYRKIRYIEYNPRAGLTPIVGVHALGRCTVTIGTKVVTDSGCAGRGPCLIDRQVSEIHGLF